MVAPIVFAATGECCARSSDNLLAQVIRQSQRHCNDRHCRICESAGWEHRRTDHMNRRRAVHAAVGIDHPLCGIVMHARRACVVVRIQVWTCTFVERNVVEARRPERLDDDATQFDQTLMVFVMPSQMKMGKRVAVNVSSLAECHGIVAMWRLLEVEQRGEAVEYLARNRVSRPPVSWRR